MAGFRAMKKVPGYPGERDSLSSCPAPMSVDRESGTCRGCGTGLPAPFYTVRGVPRHSILLMDNSREAKEYPLGDIELCFCPHCGLIQNRCFQSDGMEYGDRYEATLEHSARFREFSNALASDLIRRHGLRGRTIAEIGCGDGEFLRRICRMGNNRGIGIDPACQGSGHSEDSGLPRDANANTSATPKQAGSITFIADEFKYHRELLAPVDAVLCRHTLEHIADPAGFIMDVRSAVGINAPLVFFEMPNVDWTLEQSAFWDIYYEHCCYFSAISLTMLFEAGGFQVERTKTGFSGQFLMIEARPREISSMIDGNYSPPKRRHGRISGKCTDEGVENIVGLFA